jgi:hypothetical protein
MNGISILKHLRKNQMWDAGCAWGRGVGRGIEKQ